MKSLSVHITEAFVTEAKKEKFKGIVIMNNTITSSDFGEVVKTINDLKVGKLYIWNDPGEDEWISHMKLTKIEDDVYSFVCDIDKDIEYDEYKFELQGIIKRKELYHQK